MSNSSDSPPLLEIKDLEVAFHLKRGPVIALNKLNLTIKSGETMGLVGESGCGKSLTSLAILGLIPDTGKIHGGEIRFQGKDLLQLSSKQMRKIPRQSDFDDFSRPDDRIKPSNPYW